MLIADDHPIFRDGLASLLEPARPASTVVGRAADGIEAVELAARRRPDVVIMDIQMPRLNGIEATRQIVAADPSIGILVITMGEDDSTVFSADPRRRPRLSAQGRRAGRDRPRDHHCARRRRGLRRIAGPADRRRPQPRAGAPASRPSLS